MDSRHANIDMDIIKVVFLLSHCLDLRDCQRVLFYMIPVLILLFCYFQKDLSPLVKDLEPGNPEEEAPIPYVLMLSITGQSSPFLTKMLAFAMFRP